MIRTDVIVDDTAVRLVEEGARTSPGRMKTAYRRNIGRLRVRVLNRLTVEPPKWPAGKKRDWQSERQRRAYWATNGFGGGIPTQRTGKLLASYDVKLLDIADGGVLSITNSDPKARFVIGDDAQRMHIATGYVQIKTVAPEAKAEAEFILRETWFTVVDGRV